MLARKGTVKDITHMFKTPGSNLTGVEKSRFDAIQSAVEKITGDVNPPPDKDKLSECFRLCTTEPSPKVLSQVVFLLRRKIGAKQYRIAENALLVIEHFVRYGDGTLQSSIGSNFFLMELVRLVNKYSGTKQTDSERALQKHMLGLIHAWGVSFDTSAFRSHATNYISVYFELKQEGFVFADTPDPNMVPLNVIKASPRGGLSATGSFRNADIAPSIATASDIATDQAIHDIDHRDDFGDAAFTGMDDVDGNGSVISLASNGEPKVSAEELEFNQRQLDNFEKTQAVLKSFDPFSQPQYDDVNHAQYHVDSARGGNKSSSDPRRPPMHTETPTHRRGGSYGSSFESVDSEDGKGFSMEFGGSGANRAPIRRPTPPSALDSRYIADGMTQISPGKDIHSPHGSVFSDITMESVRYPIPTPPAQTNSPLLDRVAVSIQLLREFLLATGCREDLFTNDVARDVSKELKSQHKLLLQELDRPGKSPTLYQQWTTMNEAVMETLWSYDSIVEGKVSVFEVKAVLRSPKSASLSIVNIYHTSSSTTPTSSGYNNAYRNNSSSGYGVGFGSGFGENPVISSPHRSSVGVGVPPTNLSESFYRAPASTSTNIYGGVPGVSSNSSVGSQGRAMRSSSGGRFNVLGQGSIDTDDNMSQGGGSRGPARSGGSVTSNNSRSRYDLVAPQQQQPNQYEDNSSVYSNGGNSSNGVRPHSQYPTNSTIGNGMRYAPQHQQAPPQGVYKHIPTGPELPPSSSSSVHSGSGSGNGSYQQQQYQQQQLYLQQQQQYQQQQLFLQQQQQYQQQAQPLSARSQQSYQTHSQTMTMGASMQENASTNPFDSFM